MNILGNPLIRKRRNFMNLFVSIELLRNFGGTVCNDCPTFWPGNLDGALWYSLTSMRCQIIVLTNLAILTKCVLRILPNYGHLKTVIQANKFFGRGVLPALLKVTII